MINVKYDPETGYVCGDAYVNAFVVNVVNKNNADKSLAHKITVGSVLIVDEFRLQVKLGNLDKNDILFVYDSDDGTVNHIPVDKNGSIQHYPKGFCDYYDILAMKLAGWM